MLGLSTLLWLERHFLCRGTQAQLVRLDLAGTSKVVLRPTILAMEECLDK